MRMPEAAQLGAPGEWAEEKLPPPSPPRRVRSQGDWVPYSKQLGGIPIADGCRSTAETPFGHKSFAVTFMSPDKVTPSRRGTTCRSVRRPRHTWTPEHTTTLPTHLTRDSARRVPSLAAHASPFGNHFGEWILRKGLSLLAQARSARTSPRLVE